MAKKLNVYWNKTLVGLLIQDDHGDLQFQYSISWLHSEQATPISCSLPLQEAVYKRKACRGFFEGILPESLNRRVIARNLGISPNNDFALLEKIGGECAGAISFLSDDDDVTDQVEQYQIIDEHGLAEKLRELPGRPLLAGEEGPRLSLAGVQDKVAIYLSEKTIGIPLYGAPSTHIIKPAIPEYPGIVHNEAFCLRLANAVGLNAAMATVEYVQDIEYLLIERYDRKRVDPKVASSQVKIERLHQEDFCQALGIASDRKYQNEGGPSFTDCFQLIRNYSEVPVLDIQRLLDVIIFNFLIGNCDAHGKNFSFILGREIYLAPFYDLVCTTYYDELSKKLAMSIGGEYRIDKISIRHFEQLAHDVGLAPAGVRNRVINVSNRILSVLDEGNFENDIERKIAETIQWQCKRILTGTGK